MAITLKQKGIFIQLRAEGKSFDTISKELKISKPTLIKLQLELNNEISNLRYLFYESLIEKYKLTIKQKTELLCKQINKVNNEIDKKDFSALSVKDLIIIRERMLTELNQLIDDMSYNTGEYQQNLLEGLDFGSTEITIPLY